MYTEPEVDDILKRVDYSHENEAVWRPIGEMENNFSTVGNQ
jgi:hypothetical protein